jgi:hypothetical protein
MKDDDMGGTCSTHEKDETFILIVAGMPERKRPSWRLRIKRADNTQTNLKECGARTRTHSNS